jgi:hypothetical protein
MYAVAFPETLLLFDESGQVLERMGREALPASLRRIGTTPNGIVVAAARDAKFIANADLTTWQPTAVAVQWSQPQAPPSELREQLLHAERGPGLPADRVLLDLHSGRIFGAWGPWLMDGAAVAFVVLGITGLINWSRRRGMRAQRRATTDSEE